MTGASRGLGLGFAQHYAAAGWRAIATCRDPSSAPDLRATTGIEVWPLDLADPATVAAAAARLGRDPLDLLLSNAGIYGGRSRFGGMDYAAWAEVFQVNVMGALRVAEAFVDNVARSDQRRMVFVSSRMGSIDDAGGGNYAYRTSKAALNMLVRAMSHDLSGRGIIAAAVHPGWVRTAMGGKSAPTTVAESVGRLAAVIAALDASKSGGFYANDGGVIPW
ncbi:MAG: SDR family oxidoreductase [Rhodospirillaceae bacterium]